MNITLPQGMQINAPILPGFENILTLPALELVAKLHRVHHLVNQFDKLHYFPAYELVVDVLRDYRFYDIDLAHPNFAATQFVLEHFAESCMNKGTQQLMEDIKKLVIARNHKAFNPTSNQHQQFLKAQLQKATLLQHQHPYLDFERELRFFDGSN